MTINSLENSLTVVENLIGDYHSKVLTDLKSMKMKNLLKKKNPYEAAGEGVKTAQSYVEWAVSAWLSSSKESKFGGTVMEGLVQYVAAEYGEAQKSTLTGIDCEKYDDHYIDLIQGKSGPNWGNSDQQCKMVLNFQEAERIIKKYNPNEEREIRYINGCCYGSDNGIKNTKHGTYIKKCGQEFWEYLTGDSQFYLKIIDPFVKNNKFDHFGDEYNKAINLLTASFIKDYCKSDGSIDWDKIVALSSAKKSKVKKGN